MKTKTLPRPNPTSVVSTATPTGTVPGRFTVGLDLGDVHHYVCVLNPAGEGELGTPTHKSCQRDLNAGTAARLRTVLESKARLHPTQQPSALPTSWRCSGQHRSMVLRDCFISARSVRFRSWLRRFQLYSPFLPS